MILCGQKNIGLLLNLDAMAEELIETGIMENAQQDTNGIWKSHIDTTQIFSCDETPQFELVYADKEDACWRMYCENRECVTIQSFLSFQVNNRRKIMS